MEISDIELVRTIIETGSLSESSERLHQSQPTLSRKLSRLEHRLGTTLFHRSARGLVATEIAHFIVDNAGPIDEQLSKIRRHVERVTQLDTGVLNIGVGPIVEQTLLPELLEQFWLASGAIQLSVTTGDDRTLARLFETSAVDVIIGPFPADDWVPRGFVARPMVSEEFVAVARPGHPLFSRRQLTLEQLAEYSLALPRTASTGSNDLATLRSPKLRVDNYTLLTHLTMNTDALCLGPRIVFADALETGRLKVLEVDLDARWRSTLIVRPEALETPLVSRFVALCEAAASRLPSIDRLRGTGKQNA